MPHTSDISAKKHFGQNFLVNTRMQAIIASTMRQFVLQYPDYSILEIGPGRGDLTKYFVQFDRRVFAVDIDEDLLFILQQQFQEEQDFHLHFFDALQNMSQLSNQMPGFDPQRAILLSNLPFSVGSRMLVELGVQYPQMPFAVILQKEVNDKLKPDAHFTLFAAWIELFWNIHQHCAIPPHNFYPQPNVTSSLISATPRTGLPAYLATPQQRKTALNILKTLFAHPKKTAWNNLKFSPLTPQQMQDMYADNNWQQTLRVTRQSYRNILEEVLQRVNVGE